MAPRVSVIIATYNYGQYLAGAIDSALGQSCSSIEIVVVDDGSTDATPNVVAPYVRNDRIRYHRTDHVGQPAAKNIGIKLAHAPLIAFLDADDLWLAAKLEKQVPLFETNERLGVVYTRRCFMDSNGRPLAREEGECYRGEVLPHIFRANFVCFSSSVVHRKVFDKIGLFDETIPMAIDYDLWLRAACHFEFDYVDEPLVRYRTGHANLSQHGGERLLLALRIMARFLDQGNGRSRLSPGDIRQAFAETYAHLGLTARERSALYAIYWYCRSIRVRPLYWHAWRGAVAAMIPERGRRVLRRALRRSKVPV